MTKRDKFEMIKELVAGNKELVEFCDKEIELLDKKSASNKARKEKRLEEHKLLEDEIFKIVNGVSCVSCKDIAVELGLSVQKVAPRMNAMADSGRLKKEFDKKVAYFSVPRETSETVETE